MTHLVIQVTCKEPYEWTDSTADEWEFSPAARNTNGSKPFHVRSRHHLRLGEGCRLSVMHLRISYAHTHACAIAACVENELAIVFACDSPYDCIALAALGWHHCKIPVLHGQVVAYDYGIKHNILRRLASMGCRVTVVPADYPAKKVMEMNPDGVFLSNGPVRSSDLSSKTLSLWRAAEFYTSLHAVRDLSSRMELRIAGSNAATQVLVNNREVFLDQMHAATGRHVTVVPLQQAKPALRLLQGDPSAVLYTVTQI